MALPIAESMEPRKDLLMTVAIWNGKVVAESDRTILVEGNHYFPPESIHEEYFIPSDTQTTCGWKGTASYKSLSVDGETNTDACWYYPSPKEQASNIKDHFAFWKGVTVRDSSGGKDQTPDGVVCST